MEFYKKITAGDILIKCIDANNNYSISSKNDPVPDGYVNHVWEKSGSWERISKAEAEEILGYSIET